MSMDSVILLDARGRKHLVRLESRMTRVDGLGVVDASKIAGSVGRTVEVAGKRFLVLSPSVTDLLECMRRGAQIVTPKDSASIVQRCDIGAGDVVVEGGGGSGAMTIALSRAVFPSGRVVSYEIREDHSATVLENVAMAGLSDIVEVRTMDITEGIGERGVKAVVLDIPEPWRAVGCAWEALAPCGHLASYSPTIEQVKQTVEAIKSLPFVELLTTEIIERDIEVRETGTRPSFNTLGHTGYITTARKVLESL